MFRSVDTRFVGLPGTKDTLKRFTEGISFKASSLMGMKVAKNTRLLPTKNDNDNEVIRYSKIFI